MINSSLGQLIFFLLTPVSHIGASLFLVKPRFSKAVTAVIWLLYAALMLLLASEELGEELIHHKTEAKDHCNNNNNWYQFHNFSYLMPKGPDPREYHNLPWG